MFARTAFLEAGTGKSRRASPARRWRLCVKHRYGSVPRFSKRAPVTVRAPCGGPSPLRSEGQLQSSWWAGARKLAGPTLQLRYGRLGAGASEGRGSVGGVDGRGLAAEMS